MDQPRRHRRLRDRPSHALVTGPGGLSPYDETVPHPGPDARLARRFSDLRASRPAVDLTALRELVLLVSSSRGGSSMLAEILRRHPQLLSIPGETNPYVVLAQIAGGDAATFSEDLAREVGRPVLPGEEMDPARLTSDVRWRLALQWPRVEVPEGRVAAAVDSALSGCEGTDELALTARILDALAIPSISPAFYDIGGGDPDGPGLQEPIVEMTPYIGFRSRRPANRPELGTSPLVLATPRNSYRLAWLTALFPKARIRILHLTRNPAAAVNGLLDGWQHWGFFSTAVDRDLDIEGYSDRYPWGRRWWKYDVPPRWEDLVRRSLPAVAAEQWRSAHDAVLRHAADTGAPVLRLRYEDVVGTSTQRAEAGERLAVFLGLDRDTTVEAVVTGTRPVMATEAPRQRRWSAGRHDLGPALAEPSLWDTAVALGYEAEERLWI